MADAEPATVAAGSDAATAGESDAAIAGESDVVALQADEVVISNLAGGVVATLPLEAADGNRKIFGLKQRIQEVEGTHVAFQRLVLPGGRIALDDEELPAGETLHLTLVRDESAMWSWNTTGFAGAELLVTDGPHTVIFPHSWPDFVNVITVEPVRSGKHYFEFVMHHIGDEQWCGVTDWPTQVGTRTYGRSLHAWTYYCGRRHMSGSITDGKAALHTLGNAVKEFAPVRDGTIIGLLVDADRGLVAFANDGVPQGACEVAKEPLYLCTHVDDHGDKVELRHPSLAEVPEGLLEMLEGLSCSP